MRTFAAVGKFSLLLAFTAAALSAHRRGDPEPLLKGMNISVWIISIGFAAFILFYRVLEVLQILKLLGGG
jgi:hypothetical protein